MHAEQELARPIREIENAFIALSDGCRLAARIWMPVDAERRPVPAILEYVPYRKDDGTANEDATRHPYFASRGYASVRVDIRGTGDSDGILADEYLLQEQGDALGVLAWLAAQPWCTGDVGIIGYSWGGVAALQVAARRPPELKAVVSLCSTDDRYLDDCHYMGGCLLASDMLKWATTMRASAALPPDPRFVGERWKRMWLERLEGSSPFVEAWLSHQRRDAYWRHGSVAEDYGAITCPVFLVGGWADAYRNSIPRMLERLDCPRKGLIGPWGHMFPERGVPGPAIDFLAECVRWWDHWLKGIDSGLMDEPMLTAWMQDWAPPSAYHAERPGRWVTARAWPPDGVLPIGWTLLADDAPASADGTLARVADDREYGRAVPADDETPPRGSPLTLVGSQACGETAGVWCANGLADELPGDQRDDDSRSLSFTSAPLEQPLDVLGFPEARLLLTADRARALVAVRLCDVAPDESSLLVSWGLLDLTHRDSHEAPEPLERGRPYDVRVSLNATAHSFATGHRLRLSVSPTYWPHAWPSPERVALTAWVDDHSGLTLPVLEGRVRESGPARVPPFLGRAGAAPPPDPSSGRPGRPPGGSPDRRPGIGPDVHRRERQTLDNPATGLHRIVDREEHESGVESTGTTYGLWSTDTYTIQETDPLSAGVRCEREIRIERHDWSTRVLARSSMVADADRFLVADTLEAYETPQGSGSAENAPAAETLVWARTRDISIARDLR